jgi:inosine-uridine nucleoside N-ribohydrolase
MAMLLALAASPEELEICMLSVTYGNVPLQRFVANTKPRPLICDYALTATTTAASVTFWQSSMSSNMSLSGARRMDDRKALEP